MNTNKKTQLSNVQLQVVELRNSGKNNADIAVIMGKYKKWVSKIVNQINKFDKNAIKLGTIKHVTPEQKLKKDNLLAESDNIRKIEELLRKTYPKLFNINRIPLEVGVCKKIMELGLLDGYSNLAIQNFFKRWTGHTEYRKSCWQLKSRYSLEGEEVCLISASDMRGYQPQKKKSKAVTPSKAVTAPKPKEIKLIPSKVKEIKVIDIEPIKSGPVIKIKKRRTLSLKVG